MNDTDATLLQRFTQILNAGECGAGNHYTFQLPPLSRDELIQICDALTVAASAPVAALMITHRESGAVSRDLTYGCDPAEQARTEQLGGDYIPLYRHDGR